MFCLVELMLMNLPLPAHPFRTSGGSSKDANCKYSSGSTGKALNKQEGMRIKVWSYFYPHYVAAHDCSRCAHLLLSNETSTCQSKHWNNGGVAHISCPTGRQIRFLPCKRSRTHLANPGPEGDYELDIISITPNAQ